LRAQLDQIDPAIADLKRALQNIQHLKCNKLTQTLFNAGVLLVSQEKFGEALPYLERYLSIAQDVSAQEYYTIGTAYARLERYQEAISMVEQAMALSEEPEKPHYQLANFLYSETNQPRKRRDVLETLVEVWPDDRLAWIGLQGVYTQLGRDKDSFAILALAYQNGLLEREQEIKALAQNYGFYGNPYRGAEILSREMEAGNVEESVQNLETLGNLWLRAREAERAQEVLAQASRISDEGEIAFNLAQTYATQEDWQEVIRFATRALNKGGLGDETGRAWTLLGSARYYVGKDSGDEERRTELREKALEAFENAEGYSNVANEVERWQRFIASEKKAEASQAAYERQVRRDECRTVVDIYRQAQQLNTQLGRVQSDLGITEERVEECRELLSGSSEGRQAQADPQAEEPTAREAPEPPGETEGE
jgi:tetratricopeptide (TPR) repeat protein